ncbi:MAG: peptidoglycan-binding protein [Clostridia bacterium]|nr:peptidoglycan-binding protein [Clostridia bacterium]
MNQNPLPTASDDFLRELQTRLRRLSYTDNTIPTVSSDGLWGPQTEAAVRTFQRTRGLSETGQPDFETWNALLHAGEEDARHHSPCAALIPVRNPAVFDTLSDRPELVRMVQLLLRSVAEVCAFPHLVEVNGVYNEDTASAVAVVQQANGLVPTGRFDCDTWDALAVMYNLENAKGQCSAR